MPTIIVTAKNSTVRQAFICRRVVLFFAVLFFVRGMCVAQTPTPEPPLTDREKAMMTLIKDLQDRVNKLEAAKAPASGPQPDAATPVVVPLPVPPPVGDKDVATTTDKPKDKDQDAPERYTPNIGFKLV